MQPGFLTLNFPFSLHSYAALEFASILARSLEAQMTIVHVNDMIKPEEGKDLIEWNEHLRELWQQLEMYKPKDLHVEHTHKLLNCSPGKKITEYANAKHYGFVVLGTHGRTGLGRLLMGSVAEEVVRHANSAVVTVKPSNKRNPVLQLQA